jgi:hypothetical protein
VRVRILYDEEDPKEEGRSRVLLVHEQGLELLESPLCLVLKKKWVPPSSLIVDAVGVVCFFFLIPVNSDTTVFFFGISETREISFFLLLILT